MRKLLLFTPLLLLLMIASASAQPTLPTGTVAYVNLTLNESWSSVVSPYVQQNVTINQSNYTSEINYNGSIANFEFTYANGTVVPSWIESNQSNQTLVWLNITNTTTNVYLDFFNMTTNMLNSTGTNGIGEAPQLSPSYAEYDDGASVFTYYQRWGGLSALPTGWTNQAATLTFGATSTTITFTTTDTWTGIYETAQASMTTSPTVFEMYGNLYDSANAGSMWGLVTPGTTSASDEYALAMEGDAANSIYITTGGTRVLVSFTDTNNNKIYTYEYPATSASNVLINYTSIGSTTTGGTGTTTYFSFLGSDNSGTLSTPMSVSWLRTRAYPPNGVMPSVSFGAVQLPPALSLTSPIVYGQNDTITATATAGDTLNLYINNYLAGTTTSGTLTVYLNTTSIWYNANLSAGTNYVNASDATNGFYTNDTLTITQATPNLTITNIPNYNYNNINQSISASSQENSTGNLTGELFLNQLNQTLYLNNVAINSSTASISNVSYIENLTYLQSGINLSAGTYSYNYSVVGNANYSSANIYSNFTISKATPLQPTLLVNGTQTTTTTYGGIPTTISATNTTTSCINNQCLWNIYYTYNVTNTTTLFNQTYIDNSNQFTTLNVGNYTWFMNFSGNANYTPQTDIENSVSSGTITETELAAFTQLLYYFINSSSLTYPYVPSFIVNATDVANDTITLNASLKSSTGDEVFHDTSYVNDTNTTINSSNSTLAIGNLAAGTYTIYFNASDALGAYILNSTTFTIGKATPTMHLTLPANLTYNNQQQNIYANVSNILIPQNQSLIFSLYGNTVNLTADGYNEITYPQNNTGQNSSFVQGNNNLGLGVGTYTYIFNTTGNQNYTAESITNSFTISPATPILNITLPSNFTYDGVGGTANYSIQTINNQSTAYLSYNFTDNSNNSFTYTNVSSTTNNATYISIPTSGIFNFSIFAPATANYTSATLSNSLFQITQAQGNIRLFLNGTNGNYTIYQHQTIPINATTTENTTSDNITIELNSTPIISLSNSQNISISQQPNTTALYNYTAIITNNNYTTTSQSFTLNTTTPFYNLTLIPTYQYLLPNSTLNGTAPQIFNLLNYTYYLNGSSYWNITNITITFANSTTILNGSGNTINQTVYNLFTNNSITNNTVTISEVDAFNDTLNETQYITSTPYIFPQITVPVISTGNFINYTYTNITTTIKVTQSGGSFPLSGLTMYFGDGTNATTTAAGLTSSQISIPHIYTTTGNMTLEANISDINNFSVVNSTQIQVFNYTAPTVIMNTQQGYIHNQSYVFTAYSGSFGLNYATVLWGDGTQSSYTFGGATGKQIFYFYHTYTIPETYIVKVQIYDTQGVETTYDFSLPIHSFNLPAVTSVLPNEPYNGANSVTETYDFSVQQGSYPIKNITILWNDGYGDVPSGVNILNITGGFGIVHTFPYLDNFTITTIICDSLGDCNTQNWGIVLGFPLQNATTQDLANNFTESQLYIQELQNKSAFVQNPSSIIYLVVFFAGIGTLIMALIVRAKRKQKRISF